MTPSPQYLLNKIAHHMAQAKKLTAQYRAIVESDDQPQPLAKIGNGEYAVEVKAQPQRRAK